MKKFLKFIPVLLIIPVLILSSCPVAFAAPDVYYPIASDKPTVTEYSGYAELLFEHKTTGQRFVTVVGWFFTPSLNTSNDFYQVSDKPVLTIVRNETQFRLGVSTNPGVSGNLSFIHIDSASQLYFGYLSVPDDEATYYYPVTYGNDYYLVGLHYYGDFSDDQVTNSLPNEEFYVTYGSDTVISYGLAQVISGIYSLIDITGQESYKDELDSIIDGINNLDSSLSSYRDNMNLKFNLMFSWFTNFLDSLNSIVDNTDEIEDKLDELWNILFELNSTVYYIYEYMPWFYEEFVSINSKLNKIIELLSVKSDIPDEKLTQPDNSDMDNYYDVENGLLNNDNADVGSAVDVQINQNAMNVIWDFVQRAFDSNPKIFGMVITILSLGIIALILGR